MSTTRRDLLRLRLAGSLPPRPGEPVSQAPAPPRRLPGCSAEEGYQESPPPWQRSERDDA